MSSEAPPRVLARKCSIAEISPDIQDLGPVLTPSQTYSDAGLDVAIANLTPSQAGEIGILPTQPFARVEGNLPSQGDSVPPSPKRAHPTIALPPDPPSESKGSEGSGHSTPMASAPTPWMPTHLHEVFDCALPPVGMPHVSDDDLPLSSDVDALRSTTLIAADELNPSFCRFAQYFLSDSIEFLPNSDTDVPFLNDSFEKTVSMLSSVLDLGLGSRKGPECEVVRPSDWLRLVRHLLAATLRGALRSKAFNAQLNFPLLMDDEWELTTDLTRPTTEWEALTVLVQQLSELVAPNGLGKLIIDYYKTVRHNLAQEID